MDLNLFRQDSKKIFLLISFQQNLSSRQSLFSILLLWFSFHWPKQWFLVLQVFAKGLKSEGERLKVKFWSSEMVKIGRGQHSCRRCPSLQHFVMMKKTVYSDQQWMPWEIPNKISLLAVAILFLFTFFNLILDAPRTMKKFQCFKRNTLCWYRYLDFDGITKTLCSYIVLGFAW